ncbi:hypothetical protein M3Y97_00197500 [Aphelenchoides bicaudatus]|nr:hypothetical protein M3Y97_00197500 [Aphelenchoides bicaudatus]
MGKDYATAWGVFSTIRWGLVMTFVQALETSSLTFVGHRWGEWRAKVGSFIERPMASNKDLLRIAQPAIFSALIGLIIEILIFIFMSLWGAKNFAFYLSGSETVAAIVSKMWNTIDWTYICFAIAVCLSTILLATTPKLFFIQALCSEIFWMLPWAIAVTQINMTQDPWFFHAIIFGGAFLVNFGSVFVFCVIWAYRLKKGLIKLPIIDEES